MGTKSLCSVKERLDWCYANLAAYQVALGEEPPEYTRAAWATRAKLFKGLLQGMMERASIYRNERAKLSNARCCAYCGEERDELTLDHLFPRARGGGDDGDNLVYACRSCNSSKGTKDYFAWCEEQGRRVNPDVAERYLKNAYSLCEQAGLLDCTPDDPRLDALPFRLEDLPEHFDV